MSSTVLACQAPHTSFEWLVYRSSNVTQTVSPSSQCAAVTSVVGDTREPEQYVYVPSSNVPTRAPTIGCWVPSGCPYVIAPADAGRHTATTASATTTRRLTTRS